MSGRREVCLEGELTCQVNEEEPSYFYHDNIMTEFSLGNVVCLVAVMGGVLLKHSRRGRVRLIGAWTHIHTCTHTHGHTCNHEHAHTHTHTHTHISTHPHAYTKPGCSHGGDGITLACSEAGTMMT